MQILTSHPPPPPPPIHPRAPAPAPDGWAALLDAASKADAHFHHPSFAPTTLPTSPFEPYENTSWLDIGFVAAFQVLGGGLVGWWTGEPAGCWDAGMVGC